MLWGKRELSQREMITAEEGALLAVTKGGGEVELRGLEANALEVVLSHPGGDIRSLQAGV
jgi:hypothetical protein